MFIVFFANHCPSLDQTVGAGLAATSDSQMVGLFGDMFSNGVWLVCFGCEVVVRNSSNESS